MSPKIDTRYLEIAIQTVLINYKQELYEMAEQGNLELLEEITHSITRRALKFQLMAEQAIHELESIR